MKCECRGSNRQCDFVKPPRCCLVGIKVSPKRDHRFFLKTDLTATGAVILLVLKTNGQIGSQSPFLLSTKQTKFRCLCLLYIPTNSSMMLCGALRSLCALRGYLFVLYCTKKEFIFIKIAEGIVEVYGLLPVCATLSHTIQHIHANMN